MYLNKGQPLTNTSHCPSTSPFLSSVRNGFTFESTILPQPWPRRGDSDVQIHTESWQGKGHDERISGNARNFHCVGNLSQLWWSVKLETPGSPNRRRYWDKLYPKWTRAGTIPVSSPKLRASARHLAPVIATLSAVFTRVLFHSRTPDQPFIFIHWTGVCARQSVEVELRLRVCIHPMFVSVPPAWAFSVVCWIGERFTLIVSYPGTFAT